MTRDLPDFLRDLLGTPPPAGAGVHNWLFRVSRQLHLRLPASEIVNLLEGRVMNCGRHVPRSEIVSAVQNSIGCAWQPKGNGSPIQSFSKWPTVDYVARAAIICDGGGLVELWGKSRTQIESSEPKTEFIIDQLFPRNQLLCCGKSSANFDTKPREEWRGEISALALIVPSPMSAVTGLTRDGRESKHTLANTGARRFLICEFDTGTADEHAALLLHLGRFAPLVCAVHSGGKSLHGWFYVEKSVPDKIEKFFRFAVSLGADPMTWTRSQFVRMPDGLRENGKRQTVFFLNFKPLGTK